METRPVLRAASRMTKIAMVLALTTLRMTKIITATRIVTRSSSRVEARDMMAKPARRRRRTKEKRTRTTAPRSTWRKICRRSHKMAKIMQ